MNNNNNYEKSKKKFDTKQKLEAHNVDWVKYAHNKCGLRMFENWALTIDNLNV